VIVEIHGWLREDVLGELESVCESVPGPLRLNLSCLEGADQAGLLVLHMRVHAGARLEAMSPYIRLLLDSENRR
jgi:chromate transport protein ChrA